MRQLLKPPVVVRRAMELVQALLLASEADAQVAFELPPEKAGGVQWSDLVQMISTSDFIGRVLQVPP